MLYVWAVERIERIPGFQDVTAEEDILGIAGYISIEL